MSLIDIRERTINVKIVYYGTALSGKTTSLKHVHRVTDPEQRTELVSLNTQGDRTLFFDFLPIELGTVGGFKMKLQAFTVPGQVRYQLTRRYVLRGADAVIFVADSRPEVLEDNVVSLNSMQENLVANRFDPQTIPLLLQYNKRDVPDPVPVERLSELLRYRDVPEFETIATRGDGVFEAFSALCCDLIERLAHEYPIGEPATMRVRMKDVLASYLDNFNRLGGKAPEPVSMPVAPPGEEGILDNALMSAAFQGETKHGSVIHVEEGSSVGETADPADLLQRAVDTQIESARLVTELQETKRRLTDHVRHLAALHDTSILISSELDSDRLLSNVLQGALRTVGSTHGSVLLISADGTALGEKVVHGFSSDPLANNGVNDTRLLTMVRSRLPFTLDAEEHSALLQPARPDEGSPALGLVAPLTRQGEVHGCLAAYMFTRPKPAETKLRLRFLAAVAGQAAVAIDNARLYAKLAAFNRELERKVSERTRELEKAYSELQVLDSLKDDFLSSMSHELLTPLTSISSFAEILAAVSGDEGAGAAAERAEFASIVHREATRLTNMLQRVLDLSRLEAGKVAMVIAEVDLAEATRMSYDRVRCYFEDRGVRMMLDVPDELPPGRGDARWLARVFDALLSNAAKFSPEGSEVLVRITPRGGEMLVEVSDHGPGVDPALQTVIFEKFKQLSEVLTDKIPGLGLGLPMAKVIVEQQGGRIWYEPRDIGGSVFAFSLPVAVPSVNIPGFQPEQPSFQP